jgi:hypothetical protein
MDVDGFLHSCRAQWPSFDDAAALARAPHPRDRRLSLLPQQIEGYATENKLMLLNLAARHLEAGEVYVEVGCWKGLTLAGAAHENTHVPIYACDDFSRLGASREVLHEALDAHTADGHVSFHDQDFREFLQAAPWGDAKVGAYFYDGGHSFDMQFKALELIRPHLAADALVIIDDTNDLPVRRANRLFMRYNPEFELIADVRVTEYQDPAWWNGIQLIRYRAHAGRTAHALPLGRYVAERLLWNRAVFYTQRVSRLLTNGHRALRGTLGKLLGGRRRLRTDP